MAYFVYMLLCADGSFYLGSTNNLDRRFALHLAGRGGSYTRSHKPIKMVYHEELGDKSSALKREHELKQLTHLQKIDLIQKPPAVTGG